jgi:hypothetical protein
MAPADVDLGFVRIVLGPLGEVGFRTRRDLRGIVWWITIGARVLLEGELPEVKVGVAYRAELKRTTNERQNKSRRTRSEFIRLEREVMVGPTLIGIGPFESALAPGRNVPHSEQDCDSISLVHDVLRFAPCSALTILSHDFDPKRYGFKDPSATPPLSTLTEPGGAKNHTTRRLRQCEQSQTPLSVNGVPWSGAGVGSGSVSSRMFF